MSFQSDLFIDARFVTASLSSVLKVWYMLAIAGEQYAAYMDCTSHPTLQTNTVFLLEPTLTSNVSWRQERDRATHVKTSVANCCSKQQICQKGQYALVQMSISIVPRAFTSSHNGRSQASSKNRYIYRLSDLAHLSNFVVGCGCSNEETQSLSCHERQKHSCKAPQIRGEAQPQLTHPICNRDKEAWENRLDWQICDSKTLSHKRSNGPWLIQHIFWRCRQSAWIIVVLFHVDGNPEVNRYEPLISLEVCELGRSIKFAVLGT